MKNSTNARDKLLNKIPDKPHPNCRCWIEDKKETENINDILEETISDIHSLKDEINEVINSLHNRPITTPQKAKLFGEYIQDLKKLNVNCDNLLSSATIDVNYMSKKQMANLVANLADELNSINNHFEILYNALNKEIKNLEQENKINENFKNDYKKHDELKQLLLHHHDKDGLTPLPKGYNLIQTIHDPQTELDLEIFEHGNELVLSFPGSNLPPDLKTDLDVKINNKNPQLDKAQDILNDIKNNPQYQNHKITTTGYSLGGNIAGGLSVMNNIEGVTFNPYGSLNDILQQKANDSNETIEINPYKLINYRHENDWLSNWEHVGINYKFSDNQFYKFQPIHNHKIEILNDSSQRHPNKTIYHDKTIYYPKSTLNK